MYVLRAPKYMGQGANGVFLHSGKPNGFYITKTSHGFSEQKNCAKMFATEQDAIDFYYDVLLPSGMPSCWIKLLYVVAVETEPKIVITKVAKESLHQLG